MEKKILIVVLACEDSSYHKIEQTIRQTWASQKHPNIQVIYYYGNSTQYKLKGDKLYVPCQDVYHNISYKTYLMFKYVIKNFKFDILFRTNMSSYIDFKKLVKKASTLKSSNLYAGPHAHANYKDRYGYVNKKIVSGSGVFLSKDVIPKIIKHANLWRTELVDDLVLSIMCKKLNIESQIIKSTQGYAPIVNSNTIKKAYYNGMLF